MPRTLGLTLLLALACTSPATRIERRDLPAEPERPALRAIAALEDARTCGGGALLDFLRDPDAVVRERAALALGRLPKEEAPAECARALLLALHDAQADVRAAAAFALGLRAEASAQERLLAMVLDPTARDQDAKVRAAAVEALSKLDRPDARLRILEALADPDQRVRLEAAHGAHRWSPTEPTAARVHGALLAHANQESDPKVLVYVLSTLERRRAAEALPTFVRLSRDSQGDIRLFAVRGLRSLAPAGEVLGPLEQALQAHDWRTACEATLGLGAFDGTGGLAALAQATQHANSHVRRCAWEGIAQRVGRVTTLPAAQELRAGLAEVWLDRKRFEREPSESVRAAFLEVELPLLSRLRELERGWTPAEREAVLTQTRETMGERSPVVLAGLARACGQAKDAWGRMVAMELTRHPHPLVATQAVEALAKHPSTEVRLRLRELCRSPDNGLRLAALTAMADAPTADDLDAIEGAFRSSTGDVAAEVRFNAVRAAGKIGGPRALALVREAELLGLAEQPFLAQVAREELARVWSEKPTSVPTAAPTANPEQLPYAGDGISTWTKNPLARMRTDRGELVIELFPRDAPLHVHNFIELAQRKAYDGLTIHRVVPDFVVQGGDYRGDGNGGESARGGALRHEVNRRKFARGALGMPRNDDWDSGGSQFFLTHRPTPHLDGRYTLFGQLVSGEETLDRLEVGDRIRSLRIEY